MLSPVLRTSLQRAPETPLTTSCSIVLSRWAAAAPDEAFEQRGAAWGRNQLKQGWHACTAAGQSRGLALEALCTACASARGWHVAQVRFPVR